MRKNFIIAMGDIDLAKAQKEINNGILFKLETRETKKERIALDIISQIYNLEIRVGDNVHLFFPAQNIMEEYSVVYALQKRLSETIDIIIHREEEKATIFYIPAIH